MPPQLQSPPSGFTISRAESTALFRTPFGLSISASTMPATAAGRDNNTDAWENNDQPRRCQLFGPVSLLNGVRISSRPSATTDNDWFGFMVEPGEEVIFHAAFTHAAGNLDMELYAPGEESAPLLTANSTTNNETITLTSAQSTTTGGGIYRLRVFGVSGAVNTYTLSAGPVVSIATTDATASEANVANTGQVTLTRTGDLAVPLTVQLGISGSATHGTDYSTLGTSVTIPALSSTTTIDLTAIGDSLAEGTETAILSVNADAAYSVALASSSTISIEDKLADAWRFLYFAGNPPLSGDEEDADGDGVKNLLEYALNMNPTIGGLSGLPPLGTEVDLGVTYLTLIYSKDLTKTDITYQAESSISLSGWGNLTDTLVSTLGNIETRKARIPLNGAEKFLRLKVTRP